MISTFISRCLYVMDVTKRCFDSKHHLGKLSFYPFLHQIETTSDYKTSTLSRVSEYIEEAKAASSNTEEILNRFAKFYTPLIVGVSLLIFIVPLIIGKVKVRIRFFLELTNGHQY